MKKHIADGGRRSGVRTESLENENMAAKHTQPSGSAEHAHNFRHKASKRSAEDNTVAQLEP